MTGNSSKRGIFITLEGGDGLGKSTQVSLLTEKLSALYCAAVRKLREPGGTEVGEQLRSILKTREELAPICELLIYNAARNQLVEQEIRPALARGEIVICDRFIDSTFAYQCYANGLPKHTVDNVVEAAVAGILPDVTILLDMDSVALKVRLEGAATDTRRDGIVKYDSADDDFKKRLQAGYNWQCMNNPDRVRKVDASGTPDEVLDRILKVLQPTLTARGFLTKE